MTLEPQLEETTQLDLLAALDPVDWDAYRKCSQVCGAETGKACRSLSGRVVGGRPDGWVTELPQPHVSRKRRTGR